MNDTAKCRLLVTLFESGSKFRFSGTAYSSSPVVWRCDVTAINGLFEFICIPYFELPLNFFFFYVFSYLDNAVCGLFFLNGSENRAIGCGHMDGRMYSWWWWRGRGGEKLFTNLGMRTRGLWCLVNFLFLKYHILFILFIPVSFTFSFTYSFTAGVVGAPQMTSQPLSSISSLFSSALWDLANSRPVHWCCVPTSFCLPCLLPPFTVPYKVVLARPDERKTCPYQCGLRLFTMVRRLSCGPIACWILAQTSSSETWSLYETCSILQ